jgi:hypothetical protein
MLKGLLVLGARSFVLSTNHDRFSQAKRVFVRSTGLAFTDDCFSCEALAEAATHAINPNVALGHKLSPWLLPQVAIGQYNRVESALSL